MIRIALFSIQLLAFASISAQNFRSVDEAVGLKPGVTAPMFEAIDADSNGYSLAEALESGPVVIIFYRGIWCPYCNRHLGLIQDSLQFIYEKGATVVAISPEKPEYLEMTREKTGSEFTLLYDEGYRIADAYDVTFLPEQRTTVKYNTFMGAKLKEAHSDDSQRLPIPATYIVNQNGLITWRQFDPNYKKRSNVSEIVKALELKKNRLL
ncbi:peroxiredoxin-like family protein [Bacteroidota bacterium]